MPGQLLTAAKVAALLNVSLRSVRRWAADGRLKAVKFGRRYRFEPAAVAEARVKGLASDV